MTSQKPAGASESIRVLVVDDYDSWRRIICKTLRRYFACQIVGEVSDGVEAVQRAREMEPDLIVLDIGLPTLNGIEAARQIRAHVPQAKILFLSEYCEVDIAEKALRSGGSGYVVKSDGANELALGVEVVLQGRRFISVSLAGIYRDFPDPSTGYRPLTDNTILPPKRHEVLFYSEDRQLLDHLTHFVGAALECGNAAIVAATEWHRDALFLRLQERGLDIAAAVAQGRYVALDAAEILAAFMRNGMPPTPCRFGTSSTSLYPQQSKPRVPSIRE